MNSWTRPTWCPHSQHAYPAYHICIDPATPGHTLVNEVVKKKYIPGPLSAETKQKLSAAATERWAAKRAANAKRDRAILEAYEGGLTYAEVGALYGIHKNSISNICRQQRGLRFDEEHNSAFNANAS